MGLGSCELLAGSGLLLHPLQCPALHRFPLKPGLITGQDCANCILGQTARPPKPTINIPDINTKVIMLWVAAHHHHQNSRPLSNDCKLVLCGLFKWRNFVLRVQKAPLKRQDALKAVHCLIAASWYCVGSSSGGSLCCGGTMHLTQRQHALQRPIQPVALDVVTTCFRAAHAG